MTARSEAELRVLLRMLGMRRGEYMTGDQVDIVQVISKGGPGMVWAAVEIAHLNGMRQAGQMMTGKAAGVSMEAERDARAVYRMNGGKDGKEKEAQG